MFIYAYLAWWSHTSGEDLWWHDPRCVTCLASPTTASREWFRRWVLFVQMFKSMLSSSGAWYCDSCVELVPQNGWLRFLNTVQRCLGLPRLCTSARTMEAITKRTSEEWSLTVWGDIASCWSFKSVVWKCTVTGVLQCILKMCRQLVTVQWF